VLGSDLYPGFGALAITQAAAFRDRGLADWRVFDLEIADAFDTAVEEGDVFRAPPQFMKSFSPSFASMRSLPRPPFTVSFLTAACPSGAWLGSGLRPEPVRAERSIVATPFHVFAS